MERMCSFCLEPNRSKSKICSFCGLCQPTPSQVPSESSQPKHPKKKVAQKLSAFFSSQPVVPKSSSRSRSRQKHLSETVLSLSQPRKQKNNWKRSLSASLSDAPIVSQLPQRKSGFFKTKPKPKSKVGDSLWPEFSKTRKTERQFSRPSLATSRAHYASSRLQQDDENVSESELWTNCHRPLKIEDLCIHSRKINDVKNWIQTNGDLLGNRKPACKLLILTGPSGCGKSTLIQAIAAQLNYQVITWEDSADTYIPQSGSFTPGDVRIPYESKLKKFRNFMIRTKKYPSLVSQIGSQHNTRQQPKQKIIFIEEFPYIGKPEYFEQFQLIIRDFLQTSRNLAVFKLTDLHESSFHLAKILSGDIVRDWRIQHISCNPISDTGLKKGLYRILDLEDLTVADEVFDSVLMSCKGDVRSAINSLQFELIPEMAKLNKSNVKRKKKRKTRSRKMKTKSNAKPEANSVATSRDELYSLFHSLGKVLYAKRDTEPEKIVERSAVEPLQFIEFLEHNFLDFFDGIDAGIWQTYSHLSDADIISHATKEKYYGNARGAVPDMLAASVACRGYLASQPQRAAGRWRPLHRPLSRNSDRISECNKLDAKLLFLARSHFGNSLNMESNALYTEVLPYLDCITRGSRDCHLNSAQIDYLNRTCAYSPKHETWCSSSNDHEIREKFDLSQLEDRSTALANFVSASRCNQSSTNEVYQDEDSEFQDLIEEIENF